MPDNRTYNEKVVYSALNRMTKDRNTLSMAFTRWRTQFPDKALDVIPIVEDLVSYLGLGIEEKKALMIGLHAASNRLEGDLLSVPEYLNGGESSSLTHESSSENPVGETKKNIAAHIEVTQLYLEGLMQLLRLSDSESHKDLCKEIAKQGIGRVAKIIEKPIRTWAGNGFDNLSFSSRTSEQECQDVAHEFYVLLSEFVGPVEADSMTNKMVTELMLTDLAQRYDVRDLL